MAKRVRLCVNRDSFNRSFSSVNLLTRKQVAEKMGLSYRAIQRKEEQDPTWPRHGNFVSQTKIHYIAEEVDSWIENAVSENAKSSYS